MFGRIRGFIPLRYMCDKAVDSVEKAFPISQLHFIFIYFHKCLTSVNGTYSSESAYLIDMSC